MSVIFPLLGTATVCDECKLGVSVPMMALGGRGTGIVLRTGASRVIRPGVGAEVTSFWRESAFLFLRQAVTIAEEDR